VNISEDLSLKNLRERWLPLAIHDVGAFHQYLSNVALNISILKGEDINGLTSITHYSLAVQSVNSELSDLERAISDDVIISIVEFICYSVSRYFLGTLMHTKLFVVQVSRDDLASLAIHLDGLNKVLTLRGGIFTLQICCWHG
jgi:hypothetical protein